jgi:signal transduction histidine kinase
LASQTVTSRLSTKVAANRRLVVIAMLLTLHAAVFAEPGSEFARAWLLVHFGLFLLWQPFIAGEREFEIFSAALLVGITAVTIYFFAGWMIVAWLLILIGILGGRVFTVRGASKQSRFYLMAFAYVLAVMLLRAVPALVLTEQSIPESLARFSAIGLPLALVPLAFLPLAQQEGDSNQLFDFFYAVLVFQLGVVMVLGSIALMRFTGGAYFSSVALTALGFGGALFVLAVLWNPRRGFGGLRTYFSRYLLSVGMPFELWMRRIAELAESEPDSRRFLEQSLREIATFAWIRGALWRSPDGDGELGEKGEFASRFSYHELEVVFYTDISLSPALFLHMRLLAQVVGEFYEGKRREMELRRNAYLQAVHETGARLTHDVKNLLQSLYALTSMAQKLPGEGTGGLLQRQLPQLTQRLRSTLDMLRTPEIPTRELTVNASSWWNDLTRRLAEMGITLRAEIDSDQEIPPALFDSFIDNTVDNATDKAVREPGIEIVVALTCNEDRVELAVWDTGSQVDDLAAGRLFREPIERGGGLGIGLYQAARQAQQAGYRLELASNVLGNVRFTLTRAPAGSATGED